MKPLPSIRERLLRIHLVVAFGSVLFFFTIASILDWKQLQQLHAAAFETHMQAAAKGAVDFLQTDDLRGLERHMHDFYSMPGMKQLCIYGDDGEPLTTWQADGANTECPQFVLRGGMERHWLDASLAIPLMRNKVYLGVLYAQNRLTSWHEIFMREGIALVALIGVAYLACCLSSRYGAEAITASLNALKNQIDCLKNEDYTVCALLPPMTTLETSRLARSIMDFRSYLATEMLPRNALKRAQQWHEHLFYGLLRTLRSQLDSDSPLLDSLDDYEQILHIESGAAMPEPVVFDIAKLLRSVVQRVRDQFPEHPNVTLNVSLQSSMQHEWLGQPPMLAMLLQHLLLIALKRTRQGAICLRIGIERDITSEQCTLTIKLEDSGPPLQRWQLAHWFNEEQDHLLNGITMRDISWLMARQLLRSLGGSATAETEPQGGLVFMGTMPINEPQLGMGNVPSLHHKPGERGDGYRPLLLIVEDSPDKKKLLTPFFESLCCRIFIVDDHAQAMVWAPVLPFSAIVLNGCMADARSMIAKRISHLIEENLMADIPIWAMVSSLTQKDEKYWREAGVSTFLIQPLKHAVLELLCSALSVPDGDFYRAYDAQLQGDFPATIVTRMPELNREIGKQLRQLNAMLLSLPNDSRTPLVCQQAHAVKSASLSLGYYRLAALMSEIEHALASKTFDDALQHWRMIVEMLDPELFEQQERTTA